MNWQEEFNEEFVDFQADDKEWWQTDYDFPKSATPIEVKDFISILIEKIVQDSKTMTHEELTTKWLGKERE